MRRATLLTVALLAPVLLVGCGDDDSDFDAPPSSKAEVFRSNLAAQCQEAKEKQRALKAPIGGGTQELATYLQKVIGLEEDLRDALESFEPPAELAAGLRKALAEERKLGETVRSFERLARGGGTPFETVLARLEDRLNPQIRATNKAFGAIMIPGCQGDELDLGFG